MSTQTHDGLNQHTWKLAEMGLIGATRLISPEFTITLQFEEESRIHGASACNRYFATYHLNGTHLEFQHIAATRMMCPEPAMALESDYFEALEQVETYQLQEDRLTLYYNQDKNLLLFLVNDLRSGRIWPPNVEHCPQSWTLGHMFLDKTALRQVHLLSNLSIVFPIERNKPLECARQTRMSSRVAYGRARSSRH